MNDTPKAIAAYENLAKVNPGDMDVQFTLAGLYEHRPATSTKPSRACVPFSQRS